MDGVDFLQDAANKYMFKCFSNAVGLHLKAVNLEGDTILQLDDTNECAFCEQVKCKQWQKCKESYKKAAEEAAKWKEPYFFRCHAGLVMWAVPLIYDNECFGSMICGQILLWEVDDIFIDELKKFNPQIENFELLCENARKLNILQPEKVQSITEMLDVLVNYVLAAAWDGSRKSNQIWRNTVIDHLEDRKKNSRNNPLDAYRYMNKERHFVQMIRLGNKDKALSFLPALMGDMYILSSYDLRRVKIRAMELMVEISRAICEAGMDNHIVLAKNEQLHNQILQVNSFEHLFSIIYDVISEYLDDIYLLSDVSHRSTLKKVRTYINEHFSETLTIDSIAKEVGFSSSYLSSIFKNCFYYTINDYIIKVRIENALLLMKQPELSINEIAVRCGFKSVSYFTKTFKKQMGIAPNHYRNEFFS